jgi:hypothetical protein
MDISKNSENSHRPAKIYQKTLVKLQLLKEETGLPIVYLINQGVILLERKYHRQERRDLNEAK